MLADIYNSKNQKTDTMELPDRVFNVKWNPDLVHQVIAAFLSNRRQPWAHTKDRSEVRGGGKKPWRQKGTGRARAGSSRSPLWAGGGVTFGPRKERNYKKKVNKKMKRLAFFSVLSKKFSDAEIKIIDDFGIQESKTKKAVELLNTLLAKEIKNKKNKSSTVLVPGKNLKELLLAGRNISKNKVVEPNSLNIYDCLSHKFIFFEKTAIEQLVDNTKYLKSKISNLKTTSQD